MQKSNKSIAGYHLLMILSAVDYEFQPEEGLVIREYLAEEFPFRMNLDNEMAIIANLQPEAWKDHFEFHAHCFLDDSTEEERKRFAKFAKSLIKADQEVTEREHQFYQLMKTIWKLN
ncbi:TerB family tellurite resistance protein [Riemerella columbina]|uniref:TerB family tellurite resistance protein n=1 Tax=Riemerella columbina TaxID=103810 RepID=UPI00266FF59F|nr:TerB family tellurite resistance protein [Riemerella columbina]WKS94357.1 TerB family tellurite resistance protein [Riemerella columbina]